jgi:FixJ family two-component response regulator
VLDQRLPDRPGAQLLAMLREKRARLPGVLISGAEDSQAMVLAAADGPSAFLRKPFLPDELVKAVEDILAV